MDEALLRLCHKPVLRFYEWDSPAVTIGYFQSATVVPPGRQYIRRYTGGGLVDHARDITYTLVIPRYHPLYDAGTQESYEIIHEGVAKGLEKLGFAALLAAQELEGNAAACFQKPVKFDIIQGTQKLAGAAQRRNRQGCLHQGSILLPERDFSKACLALRQPIGKTLGPVLQDSEPTTEELLLADQLTLTRYSTPEWNNLR